VADQLVGCRLPHRDQVVVESVATQPPDILEVSLRSGSRQVVVEVPAYLDDDLDSAVSIAQGILAERYDHL
jgi:hypothetical protein